MEETDNDVLLASGIKVEPFGEIALALSGGGFRAASYTLGCLSYLERVIYREKSLLKKVTFISSASGGSITNLYYAYKNVKGKDFQEIFEGLFEFLSGCKGLTQVFENLRSEKPWKARKDKGRNMINAFAVTYDAMLFEGAQLGSIDALNDSHLEEVCVNATEFSYGITFRFQIGSGKMGNGKISIRNAIASKFKLGDILAASSCFPMGFEPIMLPFDFAHEELTSQSIQDATTGNKVVGLMDGGITDNQGIHSFILAEDRKFAANDRGFDTFIYCDVSSPYMDDYKIPKEKKGLLGKLPVQAYIDVFKSAPFFLLLSVVFLWNGFREWWMIVITTLSTLFAGIYLASVFYYWKIYRKARKDKSTWIVTLYKYINKILFTRSSAVSQMINARIKSSGILVGDVYLKQIRRLTIKSLYENERSGEKWKVHAIGNCIYDLSSAHDESTKVFSVLKGSSGEQLILPSDKLVEIADLARGMDTTLWFDEFHEEQNMREILIASGQFTTCYNLIKYICKLELEGLVTDELKALRDKLLEDWVMFNNNPLFLARPDDYKSPEVRWK